VIPGRAPFDEATIGRVDELVPPDFDVPRRLETADFVLEPLGPEHNEQDYDAWMSSMDHIRATPGWVGNSWPKEMSLDENRSDLQSHADDFAGRKGFTYTVLDSTNGEVIGCVYIYPARDGDADARVRSWVRASRAELDVSLWRAVSDWLAADWPFDGIDYAARP
jgi:RimJ/RimL family protein N-acetyltransferase